MKTLRNRQAGFTLIEVMIVILVMSMLLTIAVPSFIQARQNGQTKACMKNLRSIMYAKEHWAMETNAGLGDTPTMAELTTNGYLKKEPKCPADGNYTIGNLGTDPTCDVAGHVI